MPRLLEGAYKEDKKFDRQTIWGRDCFGIPSQREPKDYSGRESCNLAALLGRSHTRYRP